MDAPPGLDQLLASLREEQIPAGPTEVARLQRAFSLSPQLDRQGLRDLLRCTLVKKPQQQEVFQALFDDWIQAADRFLEPQTDLGEEIPAGQAPAPSRPVRWPYRFLAAIASGLVLAVLAINQPWRTIPPLEPRPGPDVSVPDPDDPVPPPDPEFFEPAQSFWTWIPEITVDAVPPWQATFRMLGLGLTGLVPWMAGVLLWRRYRKLIQLPAPAPPPRKDGPRWLPLLDSGLGPGELLDSEQKRGLVWGIDHFVSDEWTDRIDLPRTVEATAREAGLPSIVYQAAQYPREVWLWRDLASRDPALQGLSDEIRSSLEKAGLPVRSGIFMDIPDPVLWDEGEEFSPLVLEGHRQSAIVCILSDGRGLRTAYKASHRRSALLKLLSSLAEWPRLVFVDFGGGRQGLDSLLSPCGIPVVGPAGLPAYLGAQQVEWAEGPPSTGLSGDLKLWAAALALSPQAVSDAMAQQLRSHLGLQADPLDLRRIYQAAGAVQRGVLLDWQPQQRARLLAWLVAVDGPSVHPDWPGQSSILAPTLHFWLERYSREDEKRDEREQSEGALHPWRDSEAQQRHRMRRALLRLWLDPPQAALELYRLYQGKLQPLIEEELRVLIPLDWRGPDAAGPSGQAEIPLTWHWGAQSPRTRKMLWEMGLGGRPEAAPRPLRMSASLALSLGLCLGLGLVTLGSNLQEMLTPRPVTLEFEHPWFEDYTFHQVEATGLGKYRITAGLPRHLMTFEREIPAGGRVSIRYTWQEQQHNIEARQRGGSEIWLAGSLPQPIRGAEADWPRRSLAAIEAEPTDQAARRLAAELLDRSSADRVLIGLDWQQHLDELTQPGSLDTAHDQLLLILTQTSSLPDIDFEGGCSQVQTERIADLEGGLEFAPQEAPPGIERSRIRTVDEVWGESPHRILPCGERRFTVGSALLRSGPAELTESGITFVQVGAGTFRMGTGEKLKGSSIEVFDDEIPVHRVSVSPFWIAKFETTNSQYRQRNPGHSSGQDPEVPAVNVTWHDAKKFCEDLGYRLPGEAEWEYAARAGSTTLWHFGDDPATLYLYAWYWENSKSSIHPAGKLQPNPLGLNDMYGNAWEWAEDAYDPELYKRRQNELVEGIEIIDPLETSDPAAGGPVLRRVLRGGSWIGAPDSVRSAVRGRGPPEFSDDLFGFRCVRGPRRQP